MAGKIHLQPILTGKYYHVYNRAVSENLLFYSDKDFFNFFGKLKEFILPHLDVLAYCLLPNHFHLLIKTPDVHEAKNYPSMISEQFRKMFISYAVDTNRRLFRTGTLFSRPFKRILVPDEDYLKYLVFYIHFNPEKHGFINNFMEYKLSSFKAYFNNQPTLLNKEIIEHIFNNHKEEFIEYHKHYHDEFLFRKLLLEE